MITSNVAFYPCISLSETDRFYKEVIGLKSVFEREDMVIYSTNKGHFAFVAYGDTEVCTKRLCISFNCESEEAVNKEYDRVTALGAETLGPPCQNKVFPVYSFFMKDPNGYTVEFQKVNNLDL